jgi:glycine/D-amino acid oxidase-like deaminating enzyme
MVNRVDVAVVGGGLMGAASAWAATRRGLSVALYEQFPAGHRRGSSHGSARIVRRGYSDALYTRLTGEAFERWDEVESDADVTVIRLLGGLDHGPRRTELVTRLLAEAGVAREVLDAQDAAARWLGMRFAGPVVHHPQAGTLDADAAVRAFLRLAGAAGADVRHDVRVTAVDALDADRARLILAGPDLGDPDGTEVEAGCVVVAAGGWVGPLLGGRLALPPLTVTQQQVFHFPRRDEAAAPWPSVIHQNAMEVYHLAGGRDGGPGDDRKVAEHNQGTETTADQRDGVVDPASRERIVRYVTEWLPGLEPAPRREATCLYTTTPSEDFVLDRVGPVVVCSACSGHGAKFAPLVGEFVVGLVIGDRPVPERFRLGAHAAPAALDRVSL